MNLKDAETSRLKWISPESRIWLLSISYPPTVSGTSNMWSSLSLRIFIPNFWVRWLITFPDPTLTSVKGPVPSSENLQWFPIKCMWKHKLCLIFRAFRGPCFANLSLFFPSHTALTFHWLKHGVSIALWTHFPWAYNFHGSVFLPLSSWNAFRQGPVKTTNTWSSLFVGWLVGWILVSEIV